MDYEALGTYLSMHLSPHIKLEQEYGASDRLMLYMAWGDALMTLAATALREAARSDGFLHVPMHDMRALCHRIVVHFAKEIVRVYGHVGMDGRPVVHINNLELPDSGILEIEAT